MECPRDQQEMEYQGFFKYPRHACPACQGLFVAERDVTENLGYKGPRKFEAVAEVKLENLPESNLQCPKDGQKFRIVRFADAEVDVCPACDGIWLDKGEYQKIVARTQQRHDAIRPNPKQKEPEVPEAPSSVSVDGVWDAFCEGFEAFWDGVRFARRRL